MRDGSPSLRQENVIIGFTILYIKPGGARNQGIIIVTQAGARSLSTREAREEPGQIPDSVPAFSHLDGRHRQPLEEPVESSCPLLSKGWSTVVLFLPDGESVVPDPGVTEGVRENFSEWLKIDEGIFPKQLFELSRQVRLQYRADKIESHILSRSIMVEGDSSPLTRMQR
jgi:hypothetical protein